MPTNGKRALSAVALAIHEPAAMLGDLSALAAQIGSTDALSSLAGPVTAPGFGGITSVPLLRDFLHRYQRQVMVPVELPVMCQACGHASRYELRELIALDQSLGREPQLEPFAAASRRVGWSQLRQLRPLRDQRLVQRYLHAVENGRANGWHTVVYGLILALYSLPLRQGLLNYGWQTTRGFVNAAGRDLQLTEADSERLVAEVCADLPAAVEAVLGTGAPAALALI